MVRPVVQLLVLLLAVPAQYFISLWTNPNPDQSSLQVLRVVTTLQNFCKKWISPGNWWKELKKLWLHIMDDQGECIAKEVMKYQNSAGHFAYSPKPRRNRPEKVKYRVGQVFKHKWLGYHGVIIGWDEHAKAPDQWLDEHSGRENLIFQPHYAVLPDKRESTLARDYVNQDDIEIVASRKIMNDFITDYFEDSDGTLYSPRPFLRELYPED